MRQGIAMFPTGKREERIGPARGEDEEEKQKCDAALRKRLFVEEVVVVVVVVEGTLHWCGGGRNGRDDRAPVSEPILDPGISRALANRRAEPWTLPEQPDRTAAQRIAVLRQSERINPSMDACSCDPHRS